MKRLDRYIEAAALRDIVLVASGLTSLFSLLELVEQLHDVGHGQYRMANAFAYVLLTVPSRLLQLMPASMLVGSLFALGKLSNDSELIAMQAAGISERQIIGWVLKLTVPIVIVLFLVAEFVIPPAQRQAQAERISHMAASSSIEDENGFWAQGDHQYLRVRWVDYGSAPRDIEIYTFTDRGELKTYIHAASAEIMSSDVWELKDVTRTQLLLPTVEIEHKVETEHMASLSWPAFLRQQQVQLLTLPSDSMPPIELYRYLDELKQRGHSVVRLEQSLWAKVGLPLSMVAMILAAAPFVFGPTRARSAGQRIAIGTCIGIVFSLVQQMTSLLGLLLDLNPVFTALAPSLLLLGSTRYLFHRIAR